MAPAGLKRKRGDRTYSTDGYDGRRNAPNPPPFNAPQPPSNHYSNQTLNSRGGGRGSHRGGRGGPRGGAAPQAPHHPNQNAPRDSNQPVTSITRSESSQPATPAPEAAATPSQSTPVQQVPSRPARPPVPDVPATKGFWPPKEEDECIPITYEYITDDMVAAWRETGKDQLLEIATQSITNNDDFALDALLQDVINAVLTERLQASDGGAFIQELLQPLPEDKVRDISISVLDLFSVLLHDVPTKERDLREDRRRVYMREFLQGTGIAQDLMFEILDSSILVMAGIANTGFAQGTIRSATDRYYRQRGFNLLRENTEGYAKLVTEYFTITNQAGGRATNELVKETFEKIKALIGAFDLDLGRVIDMTLDVFANLLAKQFRFFIKFLRASSWWPVRPETPGYSADEAPLNGLPSWAFASSPLWYFTAEDKDHLAQLKEARDVAFWPRVAEIGLDAFFELGGRKAVELAGSKNVATVNNDDVNDKAKLKYKELDPIEWIKTTKTYPPPGHRIASQVLGFKLSFYDASADLPDNLIHLAALLIKIGFINLPDLYPHLVPADSEMDAEKERMETEKEKRDQSKRPGATSNALLRAGALSDDTTAPLPRIREPGSSNTPARADAGADATAEDAADKRPRNQKVLLLRALLAVGALPDALFMLGRFPWLLNLDHELPRYLHRILNHSLEKVYNEAYPVPNSDDIKGFRSTILEIHQKDLKVQTPIPRKTLRWMGLDEYSNGNEYKYYWDEWADLVPVCQTVDDLFLLCNTLLNVDGVKIGQDPDLLYKFVRVGKHSLETDETEANRTRWRDLAKRLLLPAMSMAESENPGLGNEMFQLLKHFPMETRFNMYAEWYAGQTSRFPDIKAAFDLARFQTRDVLKRISKTNVKQQARALGKCTWASPGIAFQVTLNQIEAYQNLTEVVVECGRYFSDLALDILAWSVLNALGSAGRNRLQGDGMLTSPWLKALSVFAGKLAQKQPLWNLAPILKYIAWQLEKGNSADLEVLQEIVVNMGGINIDLNYPDDQIAALVAGPLLRNQVLKSFFDRRHELKSESKRLMRFLTDSKLTAKLLLLIAQERQLYMFREDASEAPLKVLGSNIDKIHGAFVQFLEFLRSNTTVEDFDALVPEVAALIGDFGLAPVIAFEISRPSLRRALALPEGTTKTNGDDTMTAQASTLGTTNGDVEMTDITKDDDSKPEQIEAAVQEKQEALDEQMEEVTADAEPEVPVVTKGDGLEDSAATNGDFINKSPAMNEHLAKLVADLTEKMPEDFPQVLSLPAFVRFWQFSLYDLQIPEEQYKAAVKTIKNEISKTKADRSDMSAEGHKRKEAKLKRLLQSQSELLDEQKTHSVAQLAARNTFKKEKNFWFANIDSAKARVDLAFAMIQECFLPRLLLSPGDARYTALYLFQLHAQGASGFHTVSVLQRLFSEQALQAVLFSCTQREADNLGKFVNQVLQTLRTWHADPKVYDKSALGKHKELPGFARRIPAEGKPESHLDYQEFRRLLFKFHGSISNVLKACFASGEYMRIRNGIALLKHIVSQFPAITFMGTQTVNAITQLAEKDERDDVKTPALSLKADLVRMSKQWVMPQAFRINEGAQIAKEEAKPALDAKALEFKPSTPNPNGNDTDMVSKPEVDDDEEDGEIDDASNSVNTRVKDGEAPEIAVTPSGPTANSERNESKSAGRPLPARTQELRPDSRPSSRMQSPQPSHESASRHETRHTTPAQRDERRNDGRSTSRPPVDTSLPPRPEASSNPRDRHSHRNDRSERTERPSESGRSRDHRRDEKYGRLEQSDDKYGRLDRPDDMPRESRSRVEAGTEPRSSSSKPRSRSPARSQQAQQDGRDLLQGPPNGPSRLQDVSRSLRDSTSSRPDRSDRRDVSSTQTKSDRQDRSDGPRDREGRRSAQEQANTSAPDPPMNPARAALFETSTPGESRNGSAQGQQASRELPRSREDHPGRTLLSKPDDRESNREAHPGRTLLAKSDNRDSRSRPEPSGPQRAADIPQGPQRPDTQQPHRESHDSRSGRGPPHVDQTSSDRRTDAYVPPPMGPKSDGHARNNSGGKGSGSRDLFTQQGPQRPSVDTSNGRLSTNEIPINPSRGQDSSRMQPPEAPAGPRGRGGRGARNVTGPESLHRLEPTSPMTQIPSGPQSPRDRAPPGGPAADRVGSHLRRSSEVQQQTRNASSPIAAAPAQPPVEPAAVHPSRLQRISVTNSGGGSTAAGDSQPPLGPRGGSGRQGPPTPSTGRPSDSGTMGDRRGDDRRFSNMQNTLQQPNGAQSGDQGASIRGRASAGRLNNDQSSQTAPPATFGGRSDAQGADRSNYTGRSEPSADRSGRPGPVDALANEEGRPRPSSREASDRSTRREHRDDRSRSPRREERSGRSSRHEERSSRASNNERRPREDAAAAAAGEPRGEERESRDSRRERGQDQSRVDRDKDRHRERQSRGSERESRRDADRPDRTQTDANNNTRQDAASQVSARQPLPPQELFAPTNTSRSQRGNMRSQSGQGPNPSFDNRGPSAQGSQNNGFPQQGYNGPNSQAQQLPSAASHSNQGYNSGPRYPSGSQQGGPGPADLLQGGSRGSGRNDRRGDDSGRGGERHEERGGRDDGSSRKRGEQPDLNSQYPDMKRYRRG